MRSSKTNGYLTDRKNAVCYLLLIAYNYVTKTRNFKLRLLQNKRRKAVKFECTNE